MMKRNNQKYSINTAYDLARSRGGKCLSDQYINVDSKLIWECKHGHQWPASYYSVNKLNTWCPHCTGKARLSLCAMQKLALEKKGKCLSTNYVNSNTKLLWECEFGHRWEALPGPIKSRGIWCPSCSGRKKLTIEDMQKLAMNKKGRCISDNYLDNGAKLEWECEFGHQWEATPSSIKNSGTWCPMCSCNRKLAIADMKVIAQARGGDCLSSEYVNVYEKLLWICRHGHQWYGVVRDVKDGKWCPDCYTSKRKGENAVRKFFENLFQNKFPSTRPDWLIYQGRRLELDGFCQELGIAFEYQGDYHFNKKAHWYPDKTTSYERRQELDAVKRERSKGQEVALIEVNELNPRKNPHEWKEIIKNTLMAKGIEIPRTYDDISFGALEFHTSNNWTENACEIAKLKNGICITENVLFKTQLIEWECHKGHRWTASLSQIDLKQTWCPHCANRARLTIEKMQEVAGVRNGKCLSLKYINAHTYLLWECEFGHQWSAVPSSIMNSGRWCPICAGQIQFTIEDMHVLARTRKGECLSEKYEGNKKNLIWKCEYGHIWKSTPSSIRNNNSWCPKCAGSFKLTLDEMQELANSRGGKCLSDAYVNARTKLLWECQAGHQWYAAPDKIKNLGRWCRACSKFKSRIG